MLGANVRGQKANRLYQGFPLPIPTSLKNRPPRITNKLTYGDYAWERTGYRIKPDILLRVTQLRNGIVK